jgi:hypothetical protein
MFWESSEEAARKWNELQRYKIKLSAEEFEKRVYGRDWVIGAREAVELGAADSFSP